MGADLFGSYVATVLAAMVLGNYIIEANDINILIDAFGAIGPILITNVNCWCWNCNFFIGYYVSFY